MLRLVELGGVSRFHTSSCWQCTMDFRVIIVRDALCESRMRTELTYGPIVNSYNKR